MQVPLECQDGGGFRAAAAPPMRFALSGCLAKARYGPRTVMPRRCQTVDAWQGGLAWRRNLDGGRGGVKKAQQASERKPAVRHTPEDIAEVEHASTTTPIHEGRG